jgi:nitrogen PTS system EIIA component
MQLGVREAASVLAVSEKTIYRWIKDGVLPAYRINEQYRFNKAELLEWATARKIQVSPDIFTEPQTPASQVPSLASALQVGGVFYRVGGSDKTSVLASVVEVMPLPEEVDRKFLLQVLLARESLGSTGIGEGLAIPHVRNPIVLHIPRPMVSLCFLDKPVDSGAIDGKSVHTLFAIVSPTVRAHLHILSRLMYLLRADSFRRLLTEQGTRQQILEEAARLEQELAAEANRQPGGASQS